jgi:hypothetical protein
VLRQHESRTCRTSCYVWTTARLSPHVITVCIIADQDTTSIVFVWSSKPCIPQPPHPPGLPSSSAFMMRVTCCSTASLTGRAMRGWWPFTDWVVEPYGLDWYLRVGEDSSSSSCAEIIGRRNTFKYWFNASVQAERKAAAFRTQQVPNFPTQPARLTQSHAVVHTQESGECSCLYNVPCDITVCQAAPPPCLQTLTAPRYLDY